MGSNSAYAIEMLFALTGTVVFAVLVLLGARRLGIGRSTGPLSVLGRLQLEARKSVYVVRVGGRTYALLASEAGLSKLDELAPCDFPLVATEPVKVGSVMERLGLHKSGRDHAS